jgi:hypothetical protein
MHQGYQLKIPPFRRRFRYLQGLEFYHFTSLMLEISVKGVSEVADPENSHAMIR